MNTNVSRKQELIRITNEILQEEGRRGISIRRISAEAGCTSAVIYKHFENLEHLIMLASVQFLVPYMNRLAKVSARRDLSGIQMNLILWWEFIREAFDKKDYYEMMFISAGKDEMKTCVEEYLRIFDGELGYVDPVSASILFNNNIHEREQIRLRQATEEGLITEDNAEVLSELTEAVFIGRLAKHDEDAGDAEECYRLIFSLYEKYVNPGTDLDIGNPEMTE